MSGLDKFSFLGLTIPQLKSAFQAKQIHQKFKFSTVSTSKGESRKYCNFSTTKLHSPQMTGMWNPRTIKFPFFQVLVQTCPTVSQQYSLFGVKQIPLNWIIIWSRVQMNFYQFQIKGPLVDEEKQKSTLKRYLSNSLLKNHANSVI